MNVKLLRKVIDHILEEPKRLLMANWCRYRTRGRKTFTFYRGDDKYRRRTFAKCGTAACIAGWSVSIQRPKTAKNIFDNGDVEGVASEILGLDTEQANRLFLVSRWPKDFSHFDDSGLAKDAYIAAARIEHFIKTKGQE